MTDYSKMSDYEVNCQVAFHIGLRTVELAEEGTFDPCNNPADAWPIILENKITIFWDGGIPVAKTIDGYLGKTPICNNVHVDRNPLRAAMIVFLMMKDAEK